MSLLLKAARGDYTSRAPMWIMRQAGRHLPEYRALKERHTFWTLCSTPELACEVTLQPTRRYPLDAAILFQDIMTPLPSMGVRLDFRPGPVIGEPIRSRAQVDALHLPHPDEIAPFVPAAIQLIRAATDLPLIGFAGAPLTLAAYLIEGSGSKDFATFRAFLRQQPAAAHALLHKLTAQTIAYLNGQVAAGAQAVQLFDSWAGLHDAETFAEFGAPYVARVLEAVSGVPRIYFAVASQHLDAQIARLPVDVVSVDWRRSLTDARRALGAKTLQGNLDPAMLLAPRDALRRAAERVLAAGAAGPHIFNLGHGIMPTTDPATVEFLVDLVHNYERHLNVPNVSAAPA